jgi:hypothetical protein
LVFTSHAFAICFQSHLNYISIDFIHCTE